MEHNRRYKFEESAGIWAPRAGVREFAYSDGEQVEETILEAISNAKDRSAGSDELASYITDWPTEYHLSPTRLNLLAPFQFNGLDVMEIGSGCGALTRFLGESQARVMALEGSARRARISAVRCRGLNNVKVVCDNFSDFETDRKFDAIIAVGVLEYAPSFFGGPDPVDSFLTKARGFLKADGALFVAIENQLGLRYFSGCPEDHTGTFFYGIEDRYTENSGTVTFGRREFLSRLEHAGFSHIKLFYPFPDYKLPRILFSEEGIRSDLWEIGQLLAEFSGRDYDRARLGLFSEQAAWPVIERNLLTEELSNSFLVLARVDERISVFARTDWFAKAFSSYRKKTYRTVTTFKRLGSNIEVLKERMYPDLAVSTSTLARLKADSKTDFIHGAILKHILAKKLLDPKTDFSDMVALMKPWIGLLERNTVVSNESSMKRIIRGDFIDCVPWNLIYRESELPDPVYFDAEWEFLRPLPLEAPFVRGLLHLDIRAANCEFLRNTPVGELMFMAGERFGFSLSGQSLESIIELEVEFVSSVTLHSPAYCAERFRDRIARPYTTQQTFDELVRERDWLRRRLTETQHRIDSMLNSRSWKITKPLRKGYDLWRQFRDDSVTDT
jgi:2-polyprenyl-3-methyl-5-hydroxy-6-metoxy-1,4-benzoquinol methylase